MAVKTRTSSRSRVRASRSYVFRVRVERDGRRWHAVCPALERHGGATWGRTREEAIRHIAEVATMIVESMQAHGERVPADVASSPDPLVTVSV